ncbi:MAG: hypothetical protein M1490_02105 [Candidatus Bathyarchaeota archaeon]|nr:hypothetical protein [Candidatus Bathyarchaeota archaeon]
MQVNGGSASGLADDRAKAQKKLVEELRVQWKLLWSERLNDKIRAEDVSVGNYESLHVERGTIIHATRDFKALNFKEILETHMVANPDRFVQPDNRSGGWSKFVKTEIINRQHQRNTRAIAYVPKKQEGQQPKKGGRGWLHTT